MTKQCPLNNFEECLMEKCGFWYRDAEGDTGCGIYLIGLKLKQLMLVTSGISQAIDEQTQVGLSK